MPQGGIRGPVILFRTGEVNPPVPKVLPGAKRLTAFRPGRYCAYDGMRRTHPNFESYYPELLSVFSEPPERASELSANS